MGLGLGDTKKEPGKMFRPVEIPAMIMEPDPEDDAFVIVRYIGQSRRNTVRKEAASKVLSDLGLAVPEWLP